ncbi:MAG: methionine biosynthesis protein MetW [Burkholderiales bacterium]|jgi:methionine biosynthesis protein MetW|nr:methionine biosynthesis protein MetW [Pseudomonadota bacterium]MDA1011179.1 methionine biosynthesis protein MetW [Pseudomonadota bacterium]|tara:strand:+ start:4868 stop:5470 length:603 start_codon:yes stop_codon:yes gene_type:complete
MSSDNTIRRQDYQIITEMIEDGSTVLDLGCGDGSLLLHLKQTRNVSGYGVEKDDRNVLASLSNGINVVQSDLEQGLAGFGPVTFDYVVLSLTLQAVHQTEAIIDEMLRVGRQVIVTFPNFGFWRHRLQIFLGQAPVSKQLPYQWYDTPNVHVLTINDFENFCVSHNARILDKVVLSERGRPIDAFPNLMGALAIYRFDKG